MRRTRLSLAATLAASLVLAGCGGGGATDGADGDADAPATPAAPATWPLTGLEVPGGESCDAGHPVYVAKIDNTSASAPQAGLSKADLVVEELVEGGITRLAVMFHSILPKEAGPIRSMRLSDIGVAKPVNGELVASGAASETLAGLNAAKVRYHDENDPALYRTSGRRAPYNVMVSLDKLADRVKRSECPQEYLPWGKAAEFPGAQAATSLAVKMSGSRVSDWTFSNDKYSLSDADSHMSAGDGFAADTVIVAKVRVSWANYEDMAGSPVPISHFEGSGNVVVFHGGKAVRGTWKKDGVGGTPTFHTQAGEFKIPAGHVWIHLVPAEGSVVAPGGVTFQ